MKMSWFIFGTSKIMSQTIAVTDGRSQNVAYCFGCDSRNEGEAKKEIHRKSFACERGESVVGHWYFYGLFLGPLCGL